MDSKPSKNKKYKQVGWNDKTCMLMYMVVNVYGVCSSVREVNKQIGWNTDILYIVKMKWFYITLIKCL